MPVELSIVIPAFNEQRRIGQSLHQIRQFCHRHLSCYEVIVVDDGSRDRTTEVVTTIATKWPELRLVHLDQNRGKGNATRVGVLEAQGKFILTIDADLPTPVEQLIKFITAGRHYPVVIASRYLQGSAPLYPQPIHRRIMGMVFSFAVRALVFGNTLDTQCGVKLFYGEVAKDLFGRLTIERFAFDVELLFLAKQLGYPICEIPIVWKNDPRTTVSLWKDPSSMLLDLIKIRWRHQTLNKKDG